MRGKSREIGETPIFEDEAPDIGEGNRMRPKGGTKKPLEPRLRRGDVNRDAVNLLT